MRVKLKAGMVLIAALMASAAVDASRIDLHKLWHSHCAECHGHAADFARKFLSVSDKELLGWHHVHNLRQFMQNHYLMESEVDAVYNMLLAQADIPPRFQDECSKCHGTAADFVRNSLELRDDVLFSRESGTPTREFLENHRKLIPADIEFFIDNLTRVANEVYRP